jgi:hypothetical protein
MKTLQIFLSFLVYVRQIPNSNYAPNGAFRPLLASFINLHHDELIHLGNQLDWQGLESHFALLYSSTGTPSKPIRLMVGLLILQQLYNLSDEKVKESLI